MAVRFPLPCLDCDGVLADTERDGHRVSFNKVFAERGFGFEWGVEEYGRLCEVGGGKERITAYMNAHGCWPADCRNPTTTDLTGPKGLPLDPTRLALVSECHKRKTKLFQELIGSGVVPLRPGVLRIVDEAIAADVPLAVCSHPHHDTHGQRARSQVLLLLRRLRAQQEAQAGRVQLGIEDDGPRQVGVHRGRGLRHWN